jgi:hypothetical protein
VAAVRASYEIEAAEKAEQIESTGGSKQKQSSPLTSAGKL